MKLEARGMLQTLEATGADGEAAEGYLDFLK